MGEPQTNAPTQPVTAAARGIRLCAVVPTYDNPMTVCAVVTALREHVRDVFVVDDGSGPAGKAAAQALAEEGLALVHHRAVNGGKGAAVKTGMRLALQAGFSHALQVDADGQHDLRDVPSLVQAASGRPGALILGAPRYDATAPRSRLIGRQITRFWTNLETGGPVIDDPMCGFRIYPLAAALEAAARGDRMDFDIEIAVRMAWAGTPIVNVPTTVRYLPAEQGGVSHFQLFWDNLRISWMHTKLFNLALWRRFRQAWVRWTRRPA